MSYVDELNDIDDITKLKRMLDDLSTQAIDGHTEIELRPIIMERRVMVQSRINEIKAQPTQLAPAEMAQKLREAGQHDSADSLDFTVNGSEGDHPVFKRQQDIRDAVSKAAALRQSGSLLDNSGDAGVRQQAQEMFAEADSIEAAVHQ